MGTAKVKAVKVSSQATTAAKDGHVQATAAGVAGGAATLGATGAATGLAAGTALGAAVGLVPALFTFGLSIPIGAAIGGGCGLVAGTTVGGTTGFMGGGAVGYGAFTRREEIKTGLSAAKTKVKEGAGYVKDTGLSLRARIVGGTGGTSD